MFGDQSWQSRYEEGHLGPLAVNERVFIRRNLARRAARYLAAMTFIDLGDCAVCQESIRDPCGSARRFEFWSGDEEFYRVAAKTPRSNCVLDVSKALAAGVKLRPVVGAIEDSLRSWKPDQPAT